MKALLWRLRPRWPSDWRRWALWGWLVLLVLALLVLLVWLAGRYEASQVQERLERDSADALADIRGALARNVQSLQALPSETAGGQAWTEAAARLLLERRELLRIESRNTALGLRAAVDTPYHPPVFDHLGRDSTQSDVALACALALRLNGPAYSISYFVPQQDGLGAEVVDLCLPLQTAGRAAGYVVATYSLQAMLTELVGRTLTRGREVSFTETDGTRLALHGTGRRGSRVFTVQQLLDLPGVSLMLRMDSWRAAPDLFPNVLTALVTAMSIALVSVLVLLTQDIRRRWRVERDLADALAFRKAMEDSLVTGLRARDMQGRITYVNPAFCQMVGFSAQELLQSGAGAAPYWPPELAADYRLRQEVRLSGGVLPPREGFESVFMRKDGSRFPVLVIEAPLINAGGQQTGWMSAVLDLSEQRRVEELSRTSQERLQASARLAMMGEMASMLSHELNQPLAAIASYANGSLNLLEQPDGPLDQHREDLLLALRRVAQQAERAGQVIKSVHDFVRRREQARQPVAPQALFDAVMPLVSLQARKLFVRVELRIDTDLPAVLCDRTLVEQVLLNLARNAMQAMHHPDIPEQTGRRLDMRARLAPASEISPLRWVEFSVADLGTGISAEVAQRLFTPFFTTRAEGMGLGLSLCRTVVEQHGGFLAHAPNQPRGTVFTFTLPVA